MNGASMMREALAGGAAPRFVGSETAARLAGGAEAGRDAVAELRAEGTLVSAGHDLHANRLASPAVHPKELVPHLAPEAYVSLLSVLGEHGVANNPSRTVYVVRASGGEGRATDLRTASPFAEYRILAMPAEAVEAGEPRDSFEMGGRYRQATPERALCDWIYLSSPAGGAVLRRPPLDFDLDGLDVERIGRLASAMGVAGEVAGWLALHGAAAEAASVQEQADPAFGY